MRVFVFAALFAGAGATSAAYTEDSFKAEALKQPPPPAVAAGIKAVLADQGIRILSQDGKTFADIWLRKAIPGSEKPGTPKGAVQFPFLANGELLGVCEFAVEGHDYRDQSIAKGLYTMRYGLQPVNGDHLGVSTYRDYALLLPAAKDDSVAPPAHKQLEERSAESAGTSHPACFMLLTAPAGAAKTAPSMVQDTEQNTWSVVLSLGLQVKGQNAPSIYPVSLVVVGTAP
jgi:hypothetical protein